jgi:hypothetical protein
MAKRNPLQRSMFAPSSDIAPIIGQRVELRRSRDVDCPKCKSRIGIIGEGVGPHWASINCSYCGRHRAWMPAKLTGALIEAVKAFGRPEQPIILRTPVASSGANAAGPMSVHECEDKMPVYNDLYSSKWFTAADLNGETLRYRIARVEPVSLKDKDSNIPKKKLAIWFNGIERELILNRTNYDRLVLAYGKDTDKWIGTAVDVYGETTPIGVGVRLKVLKAKPADPISTGRPSDPDMNDEIPF